MVKEIEIGFGFPVTIDTKDYILLENCYGNWWIACEDKVGKEIELFMIEYDINNI